MSPKTRISASILSADFARLGQEVENVVKAGADLIHIDVMDNHYVPNLTVGPLVCEALKKYGIKLPFDVHLMVENVDSLIEPFAKAGANAISFHPEASKHVDRTLQLIGDMGCLKGLALNPATPVDVLDFVLDKLDFVLVMTVNPGFGGQSFIENMLDKIKLVREKLDTANHPIALSVDGGVKLENIHAIRQAGADTFVIGSAIFSTNDYAKTIDKFRELI